MSNAGQADHSGHNRIVPDFGPLLVCCGAPLFQIALRGRLLFVVEFLLQFADRSVREPSYLLLRHCISRCEHGLLRPIPLDHCDSRDVILPVHYTLFRSLSNW